MHPDGLPDGWAIRPATTDDSDELLALVHACDIVAIGFPDFDSGDVAVGLSGPASVVVRAPDGRLMGWGFLENSSVGPRDFVEVYVQPEGGLPAQRPLLAYLLDRVQERGHYARAGAVPTETQWIASLEAAGFEFIKQYARMRIDLPAAADPGDIEIRPVRQDELATFHEVIETAFVDTMDHQERTYEQWWARFIEGQPVNWDEFLAAVVDGQIAGVLQSRGEAFVQYLAVLREFRRRGIGKALLAAAFKIYADKGHKEAGLGVDLANPTEAIKVYTDVGMTPAYQANNYERR